jgi:hypothetical protein
MGSKMDNLIEQEVDRAACKVFNGAPLGHKPASFDPPTYAEGQYERIFGHPDRREPTRAGALSPRAAV